MSNRDIKILLIEDNPGDTRLIQEMLSENVIVPYDLTCVESLAEGLKTAASADYDVILSDLGLPDSQGLDTLKRARTRFPGKPIVVLTGLNDGGIALTAVREGAQDYLVKGQIDSGQVLWRALQYAIERSSTEERLRNSEERLREAQAIGKIGHWEFDPATKRIEWSDEVYKLFERDKASGPPTVEEEAGYYLPEQARQLKELARLALEKGEQSHCDLEPVLPSGKTVFFSTWIHPIKDAMGHVTRLIGTVQDVTESKRAEEQLLTGRVQLQKTLQGTLRVIQQMTETRDAYTSGHQRRVAELAVAIARQMGLPEDSCVPLIEMAALIHDLGKIAVPSEILSKPTRLSQAEFALIKAHPQTGYDILKQAELPYPVPETVLQHHERYDGTGYPSGLCGDDILPEASIVAVADVVEAMSSHRPYRAALGIDAALDEIAAGSGTRYYPEVVTACTAVFRETGFAFSQ